MSIGQLTTTPKYANVSQQNDWTLAFTLWDSGSVKNVSGATITAAIQDLAGNQLIAGTSQSSGTSGANWTNGVVVITFAGSATGIQKGQYFLEIQVSLSGTKTVYPLIPLYVQSSTMN